MNWDCVQWKIPPGVSCVLTKQVWQPVFLPNAYILYNRAEGFMIELGLWFKLNLIQLAYTLAKSQKVFIEDNVSKIDRF